MGYEWGPFDNMLPPPPVEPPPAQPYDLSLIPLPTLEPIRNDRSTRRLGLWHRLAAIWCRCFGNDHSRRTRRHVESTIERIRNRDHGR